MNLILTDCDGVLLDWTGPFEAWMHDRGYAKTNCDAYGAHLQYGIAREEGWKVVQEFNSSAHIGFLPPYDAAIWAVKYLHERHGFVFRVITNVGTHPHIQALREQNLHRYFGSAIESVQCLPVGGSKVKALKAYKNSGFWWLEDKVENAIDGANLGLHSCLMSQPWNRDAGSIEKLRQCDKYIQVVSSWREFIDNV